MLRAPLSERFTLFEKGCSEALVPAVEIALVLVDGLIDLDRLRQEVHISPGPTFVVGAPNGFSTLWVVVLGEKPGDVMVDAVVDAQGEVVAFHVLPGG